MKRTFFAVVLIVAAGTSCDRTSLPMVDLIIENGTVLTMNANYDLFENGVVVIDDGVIVEVGPAETVAKYRAEKTLDVDNDIVLPGLINAHTHVPMILFRSLGDDIADRLFKYIFPLEAEFVSAEMVRVGAQLANTELVRGGVTTYADMYYFEEEIAKTVDEIGLRAVLGQTILNFKSPDSDTPEIAIDRAIKFINEYQGHPRITAAFAPHGPHTNSSETLVRVTELAESLDAPIFMHLAETIREEKAIMERSGLSPIQYLASIGALSNKLTGAHVIRANDADIALLRKFDVGVSHNMSANVKSAKGVAPVSAMLEAGVRVGLGTDGPMSGNSISTFDELGLVAKMHKLTLQDRTAMPSIQVVELATIGGARALHMEDKIGSLEAGKLADVIIVETRSPNMIPLHDPYSVLVYSTYAMNVRHTIVGGDVLMQDRELLTVDEEVIRQEARDYAKRIREFLAENPVAD